MTIQMLSANHAAATATILAGTANRKGRGFGAGVYPITPQTECIELLCAHEFEKGDVVRVESEHSAMAATMGFSLSGARSFTASSSNGLAYMTENIWAAALFRLPIVMMAVNRTIGPPWNIWVDHGDTLMLRDTGWLQFYCKDNQEVLDTILLCYRLSEDSRVLLPSMVCQDAFVLSHTMMQSDIPDQELVDRYLPIMELPHRLAEKPVTFGGLDFPHETEAHRHRHHESMQRVPEVYEECAAAFEEIFGRKQAGPLDPYRCDDAETLIVSMGTTASTAEQVVDRLREKGQKIGSLRLRMFRPFPETKLQEAFAGRKRIAILDRDISLGMGGVLWSECRGAAPKEALVQNYVIGLGGGDIRPENIEGCVEDLMKRDEVAEPQIVEVGA